MASLEQSKGVVRMRWAARILGLAYFIYVVPNIYLTVLAFGWQSILGHPLGSIILLIAIVSFATAWKWPGRRPEVVAGGIFIALGLYPFIQCVLCIGCHGPCLPSPREMPTVCLPLITGILFILAYWFGSKERLKGG